MAAKIMIIAALVTLLLSSANAENKELESDIFGLRRAVRNLRDGGGQKRILNGKGNPTRTPTKTPTKTPLKSSKVPTRSPSTVPSAVPSAAPTAEPTIEPTAEPTAVPSFAPTFVPTMEPTSEPTAVPSFAPTFVPTIEPTADPTQSPTFIASWDLVADYSSTLNPNGPWQYGTGPLFSQFPTPPAPFANTDPTTDYFIATIWGDNANTNPGTAAFIYQNTYSSQQCGIPPLGVSLACDWGNPAVQFTVQQDGFYTFAVGFGNGGIDESNTQPLGACTGNGQVQSARVSVTPFGSFLPITFLPVYIGDNTYEVVVGSGAIGLVTGSTIVAYAPLNFGSGNTNTNFRVGLVQLM